MALCEYKIQNDLENSCAIIGGLREIGYLANKADIAAYTESGNTISALSFAEGTKMYKIYTPTNQPFNGTNTALEEGTVINRFTNTVAFVVLEHNDPTALTLESLANGKYVAIIANEYEGENGASKWQVYGIERGLKANEITRDAYSDDTAGGWSVSMQEQGAAKAAHFFYNTDLETTESTLEGYLTPVTPGVQGTQSTQGTQGGY